ncbi:MAG TPA: type II secretion system F family protein [Terriglobia bacterium]|nr:type II secretion system F family protein [Terriglobia bacterium]
MEFVCKLGTAAGRVTSQTEQAGSEFELRQRLAAQGYYIFSLQAKDALSMKLESRRRKKIRPDDFLIFNQQFLTLSKSGLPLQKSLELLSRQTRSEGLRVALEAVRDNVRSGVLLSEAFEQTGKFPKIYCSTLRAGERSGSLDKVLAQYVSYQKVSRGFRKKFLAALIYPAFLVVFLTVLIAFVIGFIVPRFADLYRDIGVQLPPLTEFVINVSDGFRHFAIFILIAVALLIMAARALWRRPLVKLGWDRFKYRTPIVGPLLLKFSVAEFARTFTTLLQGGAPVVAALETAKQSVTSPLMVQAIVAAQKEVTSGKSLSASLRQSGFFPATALDMLEVGEGTGALPAMLDGMAEFYEEDVNIDLATLVALVDPVMIAIIAVVVGFVLVAFYLPLFSLAGQVGG